MKNQKLYIQMFSVHGLLRGQNLELGRDADTGGQVLYVVQLAKELSQHENVERVDVFTRLISDKSVSQDYAVEEEAISEKCRIIRIGCGGRKYYRKELLWPFLDEFVDKTIRFIGKEKRIPDIIHGHYADAGYVGASLARFFGIPFIFTGHSLGMTKKERLLLDGMKDDDIEKKFKISRRIQAEEDVLSQADLVITSTVHELEKQYGRYKNKNMPSYSVIPPGFDLNKFCPHYQEACDDGHEGQLRAFAHSSLRDELSRFLVHNDRPLILALCRPERRKNISGLIKAYGENLELQSIANLAIFAGIRKNISEKEENERDVLTEMLLLMDKYDLYGKMAIPKTHEFEYEVPELYRICAETRGCFVNAALTEPFGLTLIEASATGVPVVATKHGGSRDIVTNLKNGILIEPGDSQDIAAAIKTILTDPEKWKTFSKNGIMNIYEHYSWSAHIKTYWTKVSELAKAYAQKSTQFSNSKDDPAIGRRMSQIKSFLITDVDNTLIDKDTDGDHQTDGTNDGLDTLIGMIRENSEIMGFGVATGRTVESVVQRLEKYHIPIPDVIISSVGTEIYYGKDRFYDQGWDSHLGYKWNRDKIKHVLSGLDFLTLQEDDTQRKFKISYYMENDSRYLPEIHNLLTRHRCKYNLIYSGGQFLDILPFRASKGKTLRYLSYKWRIPLDHFIVAGDSGNDTDLLKGEPLGVVVHNYEPELEVLKDSKNIYFAGKPYAAGIVEGLEHYGIPQHLKKDNEKETKKQ